MHKDTRSLRRQGSPAASNDTHRAHERDSTGPHTAPLRADPHTLNNSGNDSAIFHITIIAGWIAWRLTAKDRRTLCDDQTHKGPEAAGGQGGAVRHSGRADTGLGNLETHEQQRGQDPARSWDQGERSAKLRSFEAGPTEIVSRSSYLGLGQSSSGDLLEGRWLQEAGGGEPVPLAGVCRVRAKAPAWREGAVTVRRPSGGSSEGRAGGDGLVFLSQ